MLNKDAQAADPAGIHYYSEDLAHMFLPEKVGDDYINSFGDRLAKAEQLARDGKGKLIPEAEVARTFNELLKKIGAPPSIKTDADAIHQFRSHAASIKALPALLTADRNGPNCFPGEAVYLLSLLLSNNGKLLESYLDQVQALDRSGSSPQNAANFSHLVQIQQTAEMFLSQYSSRHHQNATAKLFDGAVRPLGF